MSLEKSFVDRNRAKFLKLVHRFQFSIFLHIIIISSFFLITKFNQWNYFFVVVIISSQIRVILLVNCGVL